MKEKIEELAKEIATCWVEIYGSNWQVAESKKNALFRQAEELGISSEVYARASELMH